ncbi:ATP-binding protein [Metabacillus niabensis]|uniref:ATP-binding protein n=1 Tax=Metabacillus niabensis TaxID=324854 RepID=UPI0011A5C787
MDFETIITNPYLVGSTTGLLSYGLLHHKRENKSNYQFTRILPQVEVEVNVDKVIQMVEAFSVNRSKSGNRSWYKYLIHMDSKGDIAFYLGYQRESKNGSKKVLQTIYPTIELHDSDDHSFLPNENGGYGGYFSIRENTAFQGLPLNSFNSKNDQLPDILDFLEPNSWIDITFSASELKKLKAKIKKTQERLLPKGNSGLGIKEEFTKLGREIVQEFTSNGKKTPNRIQSKPNAVKKSDLDFDEQVKLRSLKERFTGREKVFDVSVSIWTYNQTALEDIAFRIQQTMEKDNGLKFNRIKRCPIYIDREPNSREIMLWTSSELANLFHLPDGENRIMKKIPHLELGQRSLKDDELAEGISIGALKHPIQQGRPVYIPYEQFCKHFVLTGQTGSGKSSTAVQMLDSLIEQWVDDPDNSAGFSYFDPANETNLTIISRLLKRELEGKYVPWHKVHFIRLGATSHPVGLNLLHSVEKNASSDSLARSALGLLKYAFNTGDTPRMDRMILNGLLTLLEDPNQTHTILGLVPLFTDEEFRERIVPYIKDPVVQSFWQRDIDGGGIDPILNRLSPLSTDKVMRRMFGQKEWSLDIKKYMDEGHIVLFDLLNVSEQNIKLTVGHLVNQYHFTAKSRGPENRKLHLLCVDESHLVQIPIMEKIIAEDRKFGLCLGLATQFVGQFQSWLRLAISENVGTILTCTQGMESAVAVSQMTAGTFRKEFLQKLPERTIAVYTKTKVDGNSSITTFTAQSDPPYLWHPSNKKATYGTHEQAEALAWAEQKAISLQKGIGNPSWEVDKEIERYLRSGQRIEISDDYDDPQDGINDKFDSFAGDFDGFE